MIPEGYEPRKSADEESRGEKARLIVQLLGGQRRLQGQRILEIGCGSGVITAALARLAQPNGEVWGVDVVERLITTDGFQFIEVSGTDVPFGSRALDVVVSNHVIEHVGSASEQLNHLREIARVLQPRGFCYLATPNRWWIWEPHFSLPFLSWLPRMVQDRYVRVTRRAERYDCRLLSRRELLEMAAGANLAIEDLTPRAIELSLDGLPVVRLIAKKASLLLARISPTYILMLRPL